MIVGGLALTACNEETATTGGDTGALQERLATAEEEHATLKEELELLKAAAREKNKSAAELRTAHEEALAKLQQELREAKRTSDEVQSEFDSYREEYKVSVRQKAKGVNLGDLTLSSGQSYAGVIVSKWTPAALRVTHSGGNATIPFEDLPQKVQTVFLYDKAETEELLAKGEETVTTGKPARKPSTVASNKPWPKKDPNGKTSAVVFTEAEHSGIINGPETLTKLDILIKKYDVQIRKEENEVNLLDKKIAEAVRRGSEGAQRSLEKRTERKMVELQTLRAKRGDLLSKRERLQRKSAT